MSIITILAIGFVLGIKHSTEPDHVIAVSTIANQTKKWWYTSLIGFFWGIGHTVALLGTGLLLIGFKIHLSEKWTLTLEMLVGVMLVYLGCKSFVTWKTDKQYLHSHKQTYLKSIFIGLIHGLAGSSALVLLTMNMMDTLWQGAFYMLIFGLGTCVGMQLCSGLIGIPFLAAKNRIGIHSSLMQVTGGISVIFGGYYIYNLGMNEGLLGLWF